MNSNYRILILAGLVIVIISYVGRVTYMRWLRKVTSTASGIGKKWGKTTNRFRLLRAMNSFFYLTGMAVTLSGIVLAVTMLFRPSVVITPPTVLVGRADTVLEPGKIMEIVNQQREKIGLKQLRQDTRLTAIAQARANDMANNQYYAHQSPSGKYYYDLFPEYRFSAKYSCENLDVEFTTDETTYVNDWLESNKGHKECMFNKDITSAGYAYALFGGSKDIYVVVAIHTTDIRNLSASP